MSASSDIATGSDDDDDDDDDGDDDGDDDDDDDDGDSQMINLSGVILIMIMFSMRMLRKYLKTQYFESKYLF